MSSFKRATREQAALKLCVFGPSGSGKTKSSIRLAKGLVDEDSKTLGKVGVLDTENNSSALYSGDYEFLQCNVERPFHSEKFVNVIKDAEGAGIECLIIDSGSHIWEGVLEFKEQLDSRGGNSFANWSKATPKYQAAISAILESPMHIIVCLRSKTEYINEKDPRTGKTTVRKIGLAPVFRDNSEYEFTTILSLADNNTAQSSKDRTGLFPYDRIITPHITEETGKEIRNWLKSQGDSPTQSPASTPQPTAPTAQSSNSSACSPAIDRLRELLAELGTDDAKAFAWLKVNSWADVGEDLARQAIPKAEAKLASLKAQAQPDS